MLLLSINLCCYDLLLSILYHIILYTNVAVIKDLFFIEEIKMFDVLLLPFPVCITAQHSMTTAFLFL